MRNSLFKGTATAKLVASAFASTFSMSAFAGGTSLDATSITGLATANAGAAAAATDASVIFSNPAALTRFNRAEITQGAAGAFLDINYRSDRDNDGAPTQNGTQGSIGENFNRQSGYDAAALIPNLYVAIPINNKMTFGLSSTGSHGFVLRYQDDFPGRNQGKTIDFKVIRVNAGLGYKVSPTFSLGANLSIERFYQKAVIRLNYRNAVNRIGNGGEQPAGPGSAEAIDAAAQLGLASPIPEETTARLRVFGTALNVQLGALWEPTENTRIGISYRPETDFDNRGAFTLNDTAEAQAFRNFLRSPQFALIGAAAGQTAEDGREAADDLEPEQRIKQDITLNDELTVSIFHHATPKLDLMATYTRQDFTVTKLRYIREQSTEPDGSVDVLQDIPQNFKVAHSYRIGAAYRLYRRLTIMGGYAVENGVIDDATRITILPDSDRKYYALGARLDVSPDTAVTVAYQKLDTEPAKVGLNDGITPREVAGGEFEGTTQLDTQFFGIGITQRF